MVEHQMGGETELTPLLQLLEPPRFGDRQIARLLLEDFVAATLSGRSSASSWSPDDAGAVETAARFAGMASCRDLDDVDWSGPLHPGSVVWAATIAAAASAGAPGERLVHAGVSGYRVAHSCAAALGAEHASRWHVTATAGALGAAAAAAVVCGADSERAGRALSLVAVNLGGLGQAPLERSGAARATRAFAAAQGVLAGALSPGDIPSTAYPWTGPRGVQQVMRGGALQIAAASNPWHTIGLRLYPVNAFVHSAVRATAELGATETGPFEDIEWELPRGILAMVDSDERGDWWDARLAAARAIGSGSPWVVDQSGPWDALASTVRLESSDLPLGSARVHVTTAMGRLTREAPRIMISDDSDIDVTARHKWTRVLGVDPGEVVDLVDALFSEEPDWVQILSELSG